MQAQNNIGENNTPTCQADRKKIQNYVYRFNDEIGKGNFSKVFKGYHQLTGKAVAIKTIQLNSLNTSRLLELLNTETSIMKILNHPNVIHCEQILSSVRNCYIITELCDGGDLDKKLKTVGHFREEEMYSIAVDVLEGLKYLKEKNIIHRDLKVSNIFISKGRYKIADFGFAQISQVQFKDISVGSPIYMSPEGYIENKYGPKTDVWAYGIMLYELICGVTPYYDCKTETELKSRLQKQITTYEFTHKHISSELKELIIQCLNIKQKSRISINEICHTQWMKKAYRHIEQQKQKHEKENLRRISSYEERANMVNLLKKNNQELLHRLDNNAILKEEKQKKTENTFFTQKFSNFLRLNKNERDEQFNKRHNTLQKVLTVKNEEKRSSGFEENSRKEEKKIFYSPKSQFHKYNLINQKKGSLDGKYESLLDNNKSEIINEAIVSKQFTSGKKFVPKDYEKRQSKPLAIKDALQERKEELFLGSPAANLSLKLNKDNKQDKNVLHEYKKYFNSNPKHKNPNNNTLTLKPASNLERKTTLQLKSGNFDAKERFEMRKTHKEKAEKTKEDHSRQKQKTKSKQFFQMKSSNGDTMQVINRVMSFSDCIGIIHYCRLSYKFSSILAEIGGEESSRLFFRLWTVQLLSQIMDKIKKCDILYGNQNLMNNPSMGSNSPSLEKKKRLQAVTEEYLVRYTDGSSKYNHNYSLKEASNICYDLYLRKAHEFKSRSKQKNPQLFFAMICYLKFLDRETKNLMEFIYEVRSTIDGKAIQKLLSIKITDFNRKIVEQIMGETNQHTKTPSNTQN